MKLKIIEVKSREELEKAFEKFTSDGDIVVCYGGMKFQRNLYYSVAGSTQLGGAKPVDTEMRESWIACIPYEIRKI